MNNIRGAQTSKYIVPAGQSADIPAAGEFVRCLEATSNFKLSISGGSPMYFAGGIQWTARSPEQFDGFTIINDTVAQIEVVMAWGFGEFVDNRLAVAGNISVQNVIGGTLKVDDDQSQAALELIRQAVRSTEDITYLMKIAQHNEGSGKGKARRPFTSLQAASYASVSNATTTIVASGTNVNGVLIQVAELVFNGNAAGYLSINGNKILDVNAPSAVIMRESIRDIHIPAGQAIVASSSNASAKINIFYEVL